MKKDVAYHVDGIFYFKIKNLFIPIKVTLNDSN